MLFNYLKSAWRNLIRHPFSASINIIGLALGIICCIYISVYVWSATEADEFHSQKERIFRVNQGSNTSGRFEFITSYPLGTSLKNEYHEIDKIVRLGQDNVSIRSNSDSYFYEDSFYWTDSTFFQVFSFPLIAGDPKTALREPNSLVLTQSMAKKYFEDENPLGREVDLKIYDGDKKFTLIVTGILADLPKSSSLQFNFLVPMHAGMQVYPQFENHWNLNWVSTYVLANNPQALKEKENQANAFFEKYAGKGFANVDFEFQSLSRIHLYSGHIGNSLTNGIVNVYIFSLIGILIFLLACVNFVNLSTARAELRRKEVGVKKTMGAFRKQLFFQFMVEAFLIATIVLFLSFSITLSLQPIASQYVDGTFVIYNPLVIAVVFLLAMMLIAICAGLYPAIFLSGFKPLEALKSKTESSAHATFNARQILVIGQFTISIALIAGTLIINKQVHYLKQADLGFTPDQLITIPVDDRELQKRIVPIKEIFRNTAGITSIATTGETFPAAMNNAGSITWQGSSVDNIKTTFIISIDEDYFDVIEAIFLEGRNLSKTSSNYDSSSIIINETARTMMGFNEVVGKSVSIDGKQRTIVGVVKDIHHYSLHQKVNPIAYFPIPAGDRACSDNIIIKISIASLPNTLVSLKNKWESLTQDRPFEYHFVDEEFSKVYAQEDRFLLLFEVFAFLAIIIACLGLMGLTSFVVSKRTKEISIRKVLGASISQILLILMRGFTIPIAIAFLIACPIVYFTMTSWLEKFAYQAGVDVLLIVISGITSWLIAFVFIGFQSIKAAQVNPADTLRNE
jgi:putative ABC transport system permease protein